MRYRYIITLDVVNRPDEEGRVGCPFLWMSLGKSWQHLLSHEESWMAATLPDDVLLAHGGLDPLRETLLAPLGVSGVHLSRPAAAGRRNRPAFASCPWARHDA